MSDIEVKINNNYLNESSSDEIVLSVEEMLKYRAVNTSILPELHNNCHYNKNKSKQGNWRKFEKNESNNWLINNKFNQSENDKLYSQFRSILNKLSDSNFNELAKELIDQEITKEEHVVKLVDLIFQKAIIEKKYSLIYGKLSRELSSYLIEDAGKSIYFREILINKCQIMFMDSLTPEDSPNKILKSKEQILGCMTFIGELYNNNLLINKIIYSCLMKLVTKAHLNLTVDGFSYIVDSICVLLRIVGRIFCKKSQNEANNIFKLLEETKMSENLTKKDKFLLMDVLEEKNKWVEGSTK